MQHCFLHNKRNFKSLYSKIHFYSNEEEIRGKKLTPIDGINCV